MDEAARARTVAVDVLDDVTPPRLRDLLHTRLQDATMTPGVLTRLSARATDRPVDPTELDRRVAGVQLIYEGLDLTRSLARTEPWARDGVTAADIDIVAADVLVAKGFHLLARTDAATVAVDTVQAFGRDETNRTAGRSHPELATRALEADVFELAIVAGVSATGADLPAGVRSFAVDLAKSFDHDLPTAPGLLSEPAVDALTDLVTDHGPATTPTEQLWAESSVTDP